MNNKYNLVNLGNGIVLFKDVLDIDQDTIIPYLESLRGKALQEDYTIILDENGNPSHAINRSGHRYSLEDIDASCSHIMEFAKPGTDKVYIDFFQKCEDTIYQCLLRYIEIFPMLAPCLWWRTQGHIVAYGPGSAFGTHCDNDVNYKPNAIPDQQLAIRNVVGALIYFNDSVETTPKNDKYEYNGGEIEFVYAGVKYSPKKGDLIMFPSNYIATHEVKPCFNGNRYGYVGYFAQGSPDLERGINIRDKSDIIDSGQVWMPELFEDYRNYIELKYGEKITDYPELLRPINRENTSNNTTIEVMKQKGLINDI